MNDILYCFNVACWKCASIRQQTFIPGTEHTNEAKRMTCLLCTRLVGEGTLSVEQNAQFFETENGDQPKCQPVRFVNQFLCSICDGKYRLCSQCGGGLLRSGKYRPKELFAPHRATCSLSHLRLGGPVHDFELLDVTYGFSEPHLLTLLEELKLVQRESILESNAVSEV